MPVIDFDDMPDEARLWVFGAGRALDADEEAGLLAAVDDFLQGWNAHGSPLTCARQWREGRFLLVAVDPASIPPSGCSIDAMVRVLKAQEEALGVELVGHGPVFWRDREGDVRRDARTDFARMAEEGTVSEDTPVFDTALTKVGALRAGGFEARAGTRWHARAFFGG